MAELFDVAVVGGGPAGATSALQLARAGYRVLLLERSDLSEWRVGESLHPGFRLLLQRLDLQAVFDSVSTLPSYGVRCQWGHRADNEIPFVTNPLGSGWHLDRAAFDQALFRAAAQAGATARLRAVVSSIRPPGGGGFWQTAWRDLGGNHTAESQFLVNATGRGGALASRLGLPQRRNDALVAVGYVARRGRHPDVPLTIETCDYGWWYAAPIPGDRLVLMLMTDADLLRRLKLRSFEALRAASSPLITPLMLDGDAEARIFVRPAHSQRSTGDRVPAYLPVGDALVSFDPLSGAGIPRAIYTADGAARAIARHLRGPDGAIGEFIHQVDALYDEYLKERRWYYGSDEIHHQGEFWLRRRDAEGTGREPTETQESAATPA